MHALSSWALEMASVEGELSFPLTREMSIA